MNVSMNVCLSLYVSSVMDWQPVQDVPHLFPMAARIGTSSPELHEQKKSDGWMKMQTNKFQLKTQAINPRGATKYLLRIQSQLADAAMHRQPALSKNMLYYN